MLAGRLSLWRKAGHGSAGVYPTVTLAEARAKRLEIKKQIAEGINPAAKRKIDKIARPLANVNSFKAVAEEWLDKAGREGRADVTPGKLKWLLEFAYPFIGDRKSARSRLPNCLQCCVRSRSEATMKPHGGCAAPADRSSAMPLPPAARTATFRQTCAAH